MLPKLAVGALRLVANSNDPGATGFGTSMRNIFRGPFQPDVDLSINKTVHITERHPFVFRADAFNLFNHPVFNIPTCSTSFGRRRRAPVAPGEC
jgi:hypothetical protein